MNNDTDLTVRPELGSNRVRSGFVIPQNITTYFPSLFKSTSEIPFAGMCQAAVLDFVHLDEESSLILQVLTLA